jgi:hypothetical protein
MSATDAALAKVIEAAREATCDTRHIPACVALGAALRVYDEARGALCSECDGIGTIDMDGDRPGEGEPCAMCNGRGIVEPCDFAHPHPNHPCGRRVKPLPRAPVSVPRPIPNKSGES